MQVRENAWGVVIEVLLEANSDNIDYPMVLQLSWAVFHVKFMHIVAEKYYNSSQVFKAMLQYSYKLSQTISKKYYYNLAKK